MKKFINKCLAFALIVSLVAVFLGVGFLWWYSAYQAAPVLAPANPVFDDVEKEVLEHPGLKFEHFRFEGWDGVSMPAVFVEASGQITPQMGSWRKKLATQELKSLSHTDYVLISVEWDHGIVSALPLAEAIAAAGMKCVLWESRGENASRPYCTHGLRESRDISKLIDALEVRELRKDLVIVGVGRGYGASMLLQAAAVEPRLAAMVSIDSYASLSESMRRTITGSTAVRQAKMWLIDRQLQNKVGYEIFDVAPVESIISMRKETPLLLMNLARESEVVKLDDALNLYRQSPSEHKQVWALRTARDAVHAATRKLELRQRSGEEIKKVSLEVQLVNDEESAFLSMILWVDQTMKLLEKEKHSDAGLRLRTTVVEGDSQP